MAESKLAVVKSIKSPESSKSPLAGEGVETENDANFDNKRQILNEHMDVFPDYRESKDNKYYDGLTLRTSSSDDDEMHIAEHTKFLKEHGSALTMRGRTRLENHIEKHEMQRLLKKEMFGGHAEMRKMKKDNLY